MPTYQYACTDCGEPFETVQSFSDDSLTECPACAGRLRKVFSAVGVVFKGSGFYRNDSRSSDESGSTSSDTSSNSSSSGESSGSSTDSSSGSTESSSGSTDSSGGSTESSGTSSTSTTKSTSESPAA